MRADDAAAARSAGQVDAPSSPLLTARGLRKSFAGPPRVEVLADVGFSVGQGEFVSVVGPSGCGKTTLLLALAGLQPAETGEVTFAEAAVRDRTPEGMAIVFQDYSRSLLPWRTNLGNVLFGMHRATGQSRADKTAQAMALLESVGLTGFENHYPWQLSGGMQQRVAIARALAVDPAILLMDEPFGALDEMTRERMNLELLKIWERTGTTIVFVTHSIAEAVFLSTRVVVMSPRPGRISAVIDIDLPRERTVDTRELDQYFHLVTTVREALRGRDGSDDGSDGPGDTDARRVAAEGLSA
jgi:NitT/TauT family transport system ATP-binding protein